jgi:hypothetical protein
MRKSHTHKKKKKKIALLFALALYEAEARDHDMKARFNTWKDRQKKRRRGHRRENVIILTFTWLGKELVKLLRPKHVKIK